MEPDTMPDPFPPLVSACIPCRNGARTLPVVIAALRAQTVPLSEIYLVDSGSTDDSVAVAEACGLRIVHSPGPPGRGATRRASIDACGTPWLLSCDSTNTIPTDYLARALAHSTASVCAGVFGHLTQTECLNRVDRWRSRHLFKEHPERIVHDKALLVTGAVLLRVDAVRAVGNFSPKFVAGEDAELGARLVAAGYSMVFDSAMEFHTLIRNTLYEVLERYVRWNTIGTMSLRDYMRQIRYSIRVMAARDVAARDLAAVPISLLTPHLQFLYSIHQRLSRQRESGY
jgi:glycosyltransferase involved in cell wall biosynthesis